jgi:Protein of unknown function (DUF4245)
MLRSTVAALALIACACGCFGGGDEEDDGTLDPVALERTADDATFRVRVPARWKTEYKLLNVGRGTAPSGHYMVNFDLVAGDGPILTVDEGVNANAGVARSYTRGARALGSERLGSVLWTVYDQPDVGLVYVTTYRDGVEVVVSGGTGRGPLRSLARSLGPPS